MVGYTNTYYPMMYYCQYSWNDEYVKVKAKITRDEQTLILDFLLNGADYNRFVDMNGVFSGTDSNGKETVIKLLDTDVITIIESDYPEVKENYDKKCADDYKLYTERENAYLAEEARKTEEALSKYYEQSKAEKEKRESEERQARAKEEEYARAKRLEAEKQHGFLYRLFHRNKE